MYRVGEEVDATVAAWSRHGVVFQLPDGRPGFWRAGRHRWRLGECVRVQIQADRGDRVAVQPAARPRSAPPDFERRLRNFLRDSARRQADVARRADRHR